LRRQLQNTEIEEQKSNGWLTTFNDLVTLLMVFFVLLFSMSTINSDKGEALRYALQSGLGILREGQKVSISVKDTQPVRDMSHISTQPEDLQNKGRTESADSLDVQALQYLESELGIQVAHTRQGTRLSFEDQVLFDFGKAVINPQGFSFLDQIATAIKKVTYAVRVEGHTDNVPIHTKRFPSNWELSIARAVSVVKHFAEVNQIDPKRLSAVGYGKLRPVAPNDTPSNRAKNRRVEIILMTEGKEKNVE
jgi:chemotaxis protein MotB